MQENDSAEYGVIFEDERVEVVVLDAEGWVCRVGWRNWEVTGGGDESVG